MSVIIIDILREIEEDKKEKPEPEESILEDRTLEPRLQKQVININGEIVSI